MQKCSDEYETKIQKVLIMKKQNPKLNSQLYASGSSFLLNVFLMLVLFLCCVVVYLEINAVYS